MNLIVAIDNDNGIGKDGKIPWKNSQDLLFFKKTTLYNSIIMGRKTFESIGKPLPNRRNIIISSSLKKIEGAEVVENLKKAMKLINYEGYIIGGESIYNQVLENIQLNKIFISRINGNFDCDVFFPYEKIRENYSLKEIICKDELYVEIFEKEIICRVEIVEK